MNDKPYNERELIKLAQNGDRDAFGKLYDYHIRHIYSFVLYKARDKSVSEDIVSQTFFKALSSIKSADPDRSFRSWLYKIAHNNFIDHYRGRKNHESLDDIDRADDTDVEKDARDRELKESLAPYLLKLSDEQRDIVTMRVWQEMSHAEIAEVLGKSEGAVKMSFSRAIGTLKDIVPPTILSFLLLFTTTQ